MAAGGTQLDVGDRMPDVQLLDDRGDRWSARGFVGRAVVLVLHRHFF